MFSLIFFRCRGTTKWVHQACIQRWVDEKQKGDYMLAVECPQCGTRYVIHLPRGNYFVTLLDKGEQLIQYLVPRVTGGVCVGSLYWICVTFGAVSLMQIMGQQRALIVMERAGKNTFDINRNFMFSNELNLFGENCYVSNNEMYFQILCSYWFRFRWFLLFYFLEK